MRRRKNILRKYWQYATGKVMPPVEVAVERVDRTSVRKVREETDSGNENEGKEKQREADEV